MGKVIPEINGTLTGMWLGLLYVHPQYICLRFDLLPKKSCQEQLHQEGGKTYIRGATKGHPELYKGKGCLLKL